MLLIGKMVLLALAFTVLLISVSNGFMYMSARNKIVSLSDADSLEGDCILVLGCGMRPDGTPSQMLRDRLDVAIELYFMGISDRLLMSGGPGRGTWNEANAMKRYAVERGVPSEKIFMDHAGLSTYESTMKRKGAYIAFLLAAFLMPAASLAEDKAAPQQKDHILVAYFSRMGNTDYASDVDASSSANTAICCATDRYAGSAYAGAWLPFAS